MSRQFELGIFLPIGRNGFFITENTPQYNPTFEMNLEISRLAEEAGLDYVFSMCKWRGFGGSSGFWDASLESLILMTGLAASTQRIKCIATVNPLQLHPAVAAKMVATLDEVSGGRCGINLITGASPGEYQQLGIWPDGYDMGRYRYMEEWVSVLKRLWTEDSVTHQGEFFTLTDCVSEPKPIQDPYPFLVCAGTSDEGFEFTARQCDYSFLGGGGLEATRDLSRRMKATARSMGREVKTATTFAVIQGDTDREADTHFDYYFEGADFEALDNIMNHFGSQARETMLKRDRATIIRNAICFAGQPLCGSPDTIAEKILQLTEEGEVDSIQLIFPDYIQGLKDFSKDVMPLLRREGALMKTAV